jgi:hypothetical protein
MGLCKRGVKRHSPRGSQTGNDCESLDYRSGLDLETGGVLLRVLAVPDHAVDQLRRAEIGLGHRHRRHAGGLLVQSVLLMPWRPPGNPGPA